MGAGQNPGAGAGSQGASEKKDDNVVDADYKVDDDK